MTSPTKLPTLKETINAHGLGARKSLGQHFLLDLNLTARIARTAEITSDDVVIEVGPGPGGLTRALLDSPAKQVVAVERDERCLGIMAELARHYGADRFQAVNDDAMKVAERELVAAGQVKLVSNLPYNIGTQLLFKWLDDLPFFTDFTLMFQLEVAQRITAAPGDKSYGRLAVMAQWLCEAHIAFRLPAAAFTPPPKVDSAVVRLVPRPEPLAPASAKTLSRVVAAAFGQRRKMLRQSLKAAIKSPIPLLEDIGIDPTRRAETLMIEEFCAIANALDQAEA